ncbi:hypothetical protein TRVL_08802 [Trypanosoma vivax]|nr:hypothetical protein TRVL_08802 [Trypanosoma vivax]
MTQLTWLELTPLLGVGGARRTEAETFSQQQLRDHTRSHSLSRAPNVSKRPILCTGDCELLFVLQTASAGLCERRAGKLCRSQTRMSYGSERSAETQCDA